MTIETTTQRVRRYFGECVGRLGGPDREAALSRVDELLAADFVMAYNNDPAETAARGRRGAQGLSDRARRELPRRPLDAEALVGDEATVACQWHLAARHAATGNRIDVRAADVFTVRDGRLAELRRFLDFESFRSQLEPDVDQRPEETGES